MSLIRVILPSRPLPFSQPLSLSEGGPRTQRARVCSRPSPGQPARSVAWRLARPRSFALARCSAFTFALMSTRVARGRWPLPLLRRLQPLPEGREVRGRDGVGRRGSGRVGEGEVNWRDGGRAASDVVKKAQS
jgi:hypothetical protein